jgi:sRNA-binding regulator protein Hfq
MPKIGRDYGRYSKDRKHVERTEKRQPEEGFFESMSGERVQVELTTGRVIEGTLQASTYNRYDVVLESSEGRYLVPKAAILYVKHCEGGEKKK